MKKFVVKGIVLMLVTCGWGTMSMGEQMPAPRGESTAPPGLVTITASPILCSVTCRRAR